MVFQAWPFLVSSNRALGYRAIVAPDFMVTGKTAHLLAELTEGTLSEPGTAICRRIHHAQTGNLTLIYRIANATEGETVLTDGFGRPINWVSGLVMKGHPADISVTQEHFEEVHRHVEAPFREFWQQTSSQPAFPSNLITLKAEDGKELVTLHTEPARERLLEVTHPASSGPETAASSEAERGSMARVFKNKQSAVHWGKILGVSLGIVAVGGTLLYLWNKHQQKKGRSHHNSGALWTERVAASVSADSPSL